MKAETDLKIVNDTIYEALHFDKGLVSVKATVGSMSIEVHYSCLQIEWEHDFKVVQHRLKEIMESAIKSI